MREGDKKKCSSECALSCKGRGSRDETKLESFQLIKETENANKEEEEKEEETRKKRKEEREGGERNMKGLKE